jgi:hypothetical protein
MMLEKKLRGYAIQILHMHTLQLPTHAWCWFQAASYKPSILVLHAATAAMI